MRIGILTFHYACNYGAMLQTYATQEFLRSMGHDVCVVDYRNKAVEEGYAAWNFKKDLLKTLPRAFSRAMRNSRFRHFMKERLVLSKDSFDSFDVLLFGSDQIWNEIITGGFDKIYWGDFTTKARKVAWAASANVLSFSDMEYAAKCLSGFHAISVREDSLKELVSGMTSVPVKCVQDPTLMLGEREWEALAGPVKDGGYVLAYPMLCDELVIKTAGAIAGAKGLRLVILSKNALYRPYKNMVQWAGPEEFVSYFAGASHVVTSSFHGTAFSIIFRKKFLSVVEPGTRNLRVESLLRKMGLENRLSDGSDLSSIDLPLDKDKIGMTLDGLRREAVDFLKASMS